MSIMSKTDVEKAAELLEKSSAEEVLEWAVEKFGSRLALASSFGLEDVVLIDMISKLGGSVPVFTIDTGRLHQETYNVMDAVRERYGIPLEIYFPATDEVEKMVRENGLNLFYKSPDLRILCCHIRKVGPLNRALSTRDAWITGLRRDQASSRTSIRKVEVDRLKDSLVKVNPLADWTPEDIRAYIKENNVPYNVLFDQGYASIGCATCTRAIKPGEDPRAGRWWWLQEGAKECGLHCKF